MKNSAEGTTFESKGYWYTATPRKPRFAHAGRKRRFSYVVVDGEGRASRQWHAAAMRDTRVPEATVRSLLGERKP